MTINRLITRENKKERYEKSSCFLNFKDLHIRTTNSNNDYERKKCL